MVVSGIRWLKKECLTEFDKEIRNRSLMFCNLHKIKKEKMHHKKEKKRNRAYPGNLGM